MANRRATDEQIKANAAARAARWRAKNTDKVNVAARRWRTKYPERAKAVSKASREKCKATESAKRKLQRAEYAAYQKAWRDRNRDKVIEASRRNRDAIQAALNTIKLASGCVDCGYREHAVALHFDHVRGVKIREVARIYSMRLALLEAEKCEVRCANCHHIRHYNNDPRRKRPTPEVGVV